jgi:hypothetical protein
MSHWNHYLYAQAEVGCDNQASNRIMEQVRVIVALVSICPIGTILRTHKLKSDVTIKPVSELLTR